MKDNDTQLINLTLAGDDNAFGELVEKYQKQVHALVWRKIGDFHTAEEITQDTFLQAYNKLATLKRTRSFSSWLYVIATSLCKAWFRKKYRRTQLMQDKDISYPEESAYSAHVHEENQRFTIEAQRDVVKKLLEKLGESERTVMTLHYFGEMSCTEIGAFLGVSANTVKSRLRRAQQRLQKDEVIIREALDNFQITPHLTENVMREIARINPVTPSSSKPFVPWAIAASTLAVVLLILGFGNSKYLTRFQKPYSFDANAEMTVEIVDTPIVANLESDPDVQLQIRNTNTLAMLNEPKQQQDDNITALSEDTHTEETMKDYTQWELPKKAKARLGKGKVNGIKFTPDSTHLAVETTIGVWLYDANTGEEITLLPNVEPDNQSLNRSYINLLVSAIDHNTIACEGLDEDRGLWDVENDSLKPIQPHLRRRNNVLQFRAESILLSYSGWKMKLPWHGRADLCNRSVAFAPDGNTFVGGTHIYAWNPETIQYTPTVRLEDVSQSKPPTALTYSPDGSIIVSGNRDGIIRLRDSSTGKIISNLTGHINWISQFVFSEDGKTLATSGADGTILLWDWDEVLKELAGE